MSFADYRARSFHVSSSVWGNSSKEKVGMLKNDEKTKLTGLVSNIWNLKKTRREYGRMYHLEIP